jgi:hypothetical protein
MRRLTVALLTATVIGCRGRSDPPVFENAEPDALAQAPATATLLMDSAAAALGAGDYEDARRLYQAAADADTTLAAPWFGLFMARRGLGLTAPAESALSRARTLVVNPIRPNTSGTRD